MIRSQVRSLSVAQINNERNRPMQTKEQKIPIIYRRSEEYRVLPVAGAVVSGTGQGMLICHIYTELGNLPEKTEIVLKADGTGEEILNPVQEVKRELLIGLQMSPQVALSLSKTLELIANSTTQAVQTAQAAQKTK
jgi:hypothetical protein